MMGVFVQLNENSRHAKKWPIGYVIQENGCWDWVGHKDPLGYGKLNPHGKRGLLVGAHRHFYSVWVGPIPKELDLDHLCRNPSCINPAHLEPVTRRENLNRGVGMSAQRARQTHCKFGHELGPVVEKSGRRRRRCVPCMKAQNAKRYTGTTGGYSPPRVSEDD